MRKYAKTGIFLFEHKGDIKYKGIRGNIPTFKLISRNVDEDRSAFIGQMVGRDLELKHLLDFSNPCWKNVQQVSLLFLERQVSEKVAHARTAPSAL